MGLTRSDAWAIGRLDAHDQAALVHQGKAAPDMLVEAAILRIEDIEDALHCVTFRAFDHARSIASGERASAPMAGVPTLLKASLSYPGFPQTSCSRAKQDVVADHAFPFAQRLDAAGLVPVGMSAMPEFGLLCSGEPLLTGPALNPWNPDRTAGGSSTGAAIAVAAGLVPVAHASDAAGSIRVPASACGVVGFKPSRGANVRARAHHLIDDLLCNDSLIARSVRDVAWGSRWERPEAWHAAPAPRRPLRIALDLAGLAGQPDADVAALIERTGRLCAGLGHQVEIATTPIDRPALRAAILTIWPYLGGELVDFYGALRPDVPIGDLLEPWTLGLARQRETIEPEALANCYKAMVLGEQAMAAFHQSWDVVLSPVTRNPPLPVGAMAPTRPFGELWTTLFDFVDYTPIHNMLGLPSITLPLGMTADGVPVGSLLSAAQGQDEMLLALAAEIEAAAPWADRWPPVVPGVA
jgi:amidase